MTTQIDPIVLAEVKSENIDKRSLTYHQLILCSVVIGIVGGLVATIYYFVLEGMMHGVWHTIPAFLAPYFPNWFPAENYVLIATTIGGFFCRLGALFHGFYQEKWLR